MGIVVRRRLYLLASLLIILSLASGIIPFNDVSLADNMELSLDVWTNKGGEGPFRPGGTFQVGEETVINVRATATVEARWSISGPSLSDNGVMVMEAGKTYSWIMGAAEERDIGQWTVTLEGELYKNGVAYQGAQDKLTFNVVTASGEEPATAPVQTTGALPARAIDEEGAIEMDALTALKMADGSIPSDTLYDVDKDGSVTQEDARQIMFWAVSGVKQGLPSADQQEVIDTFGPPAQFAVWYELDDDSTMDFLVRSEVWYYPDYESCITFIAGTSCGVGTYSPPESETSYPDLRPWDFDGFMTYDQVLDKIGSRSADTLDFLPQALQEAGFAAYAAGPAAFIMEGGQLAYIQTIGTGKGEGLLGLDPFNVGQMAELTTELDTILSYLNPLAPQPVMARISFKRLGRWIARAIKRGARLLTSLPQKVARLLPKPLRPIAQMYLENMIINLRAYKVAVRVNDVAELEKNRAEWADACSKQADKINNDVQKLREEKDNLENKRPSELGMTFSEWKERYTLLNNIIPQLEDVSSKLRDNGRAFSTEDLIRIGTRELVNSTLRKIEQAVTQQASEEFNRRLEQSSVRELIEKTSGMGIDNIVDLFITGRIAKIIKEMGTDPKFKSEIEKSVKGELKKGKSSLKEIDELIANAIDKLNKESKKLLAEAEELQEKADKGDKGDKGGKSGGGTATAKATDLSQFKSMTFYILIDSFKLSDNSQQSWSLKADMPGKFTGNTFEGYDYFTDKKGADITWEFKGTLSEDQKTLTSFTMDHLRVTPAKGGIKERRTQATITAKNIGVRTNTAEKIYCYTSSPLTSAHSTSIKYSTRYGESQPDTLVKASCKQQCWIDISFLNE